MATFVKCGRQVYMKNTFCSSRFENNRFVDVTVDSHTLYNCAKRCPVIIQSISQLDLHVDLEPATETLKGVFSSEISSD